MPNLLYSPVFLYYLSINIFIFISMGVDKHNAIYNKWRIKETFFFTLLLWEGF